LSIPFTSRPARTPESVSDVAVAQTDAHWRRNLFAVTASVFIGFTGFTLVMPFLPLYLRDLGLTDVGDIAFWAGLSLGITPAVAAALSPFWGRLADRFGRKIMVVRSMASFVLVMVAMAFVTKPWHVFGLRLLQGFVGGYGAMALAMAADASPPDRVASSIGLMQTAQRLGPALGPVIGGAIAQAVGRRNTFFVSAVFYLFGLLLLVIFYKERRSTFAGPHAQGPPGWKRADTAPVPLRSLLARQNMALMMAVIFGLQFADRSIGPILPLHLSAAGVPMSRIPVVSGVMFTVVAGAGALGNSLCGILLRYLAARAIIGAAGLVAASAALAFVLVSHLGVLYGAAAVFGFALGSALTAAYTAGSSLIPDEARGTGFGLLTSAALVGLAASPMVSGVLGRVSIPAVFVADAILLIAVAVAVRWLMADRPAPTASPPPEEV
jgi:DHA1 family multidrug resistance protein-like MFS transporter